MTGDICDNYARRFAGLNTNKNRSHWRETTRYQAPYKPVLLLCVLDLFDQGRIRSNFVALDPDLGESFARYVEKVLPFDTPGSLALPFFHLRGDGFWHLLPRPGREEALRLLAQVKTLPQLRELVLGARLDHNLYECMGDPGCRQRLSAILIETYFAPEVRRSLVEQAAVNREAFEYSEHLLVTQEEDTVAEQLAEAYRPDARDQGFRRAVVTAYEHRCALCGLRMQTLDGHTLVAAAHIKPWRVSKDDRPSNGMALCRTCHWTFDEGLLRVSSAYVIHPSIQLTTADNLPGYLTTLQGREIFRPTKEVHWPDTTSLNWHHDKVFRR